VMVTLVFLPSGGHYRPRTAGTERPHSGPVN
jgi:hypothetical protein